MLGEPYDAEAEKAVIGGVLLDNAAFAECAEILRPEDFYKAAHRVVWTAMGILAGRKDPIEYATLVEVLKSRNELEPLGGVGTLLDMDAAVPSSANYARYATRVRDMAIRRRLIAVSAESIRQAQDDAIDLDEVLNRAERSVLAVRDARGTATELVPIRQSVVRVFKEIEVLHARQEDVTGLASGYTDLDRMTTGFQRGDLVIIAGRPSMGKSAIAMNIAAHAAVDLKIPVVVFSLEMSEDSMTKRLMSGDARIEGNKFRTGKLAAKDWPRLAVSADRLFGAKMYIDETARTMTEMRARTRRAKQKYGLGLVVIDYLQLMRGEGRRNDANREQELAEISRGLKGMAREFDAPVIALAQLNRGLEKRPDKRPMLSDLRESGAIEQDADIVSFVYRDEVYDKQTADKGVAEFIVAKQRNGPTGTVRLAWSASFTRFDNLANDESTGGAKWA